MLRTLLKFIAWPLRLLLLLLLAILASLNLHESTVYLFLGHQWRAPMAVLLLLAFGSGAVLGVLALALSHLRALRKTATSSKLPVAPASTASDQNRAAAAATTLQP